MKTEALLDSGAQMTTIDQAFAETLGLVGGPTITAGGTGGVATASIAKGARLQIGDLSCELTVAILDLSAIARRMGCPLNVILGKEVFNGAVVDLDFGSRSAEFHEPGGYAAPKEAVVVPLRQIGALRATEISVEGRPPIAVEFDLGNGSPLLLFPAYWGAERLLEGRGTSTRLSGGVGGQRECFVATLGSIGFAGVTLRDVPTSFTQPGVSAVDSDRILGNLGLPILSRFRLVVDYSRDALGALPNGDAVARPFAKDRLGIGFDPRDGCLEVRHVAPGGPAEKAGFRVGERIGAIDGAAVSGLRPRDVEALAQGPEGAVLLLSVLDGPTRSVSLATYY